MKLLDKDLQEFTLRKEQTECLDFVFDKIENDPIKKFFLLDLPTGVGKSILALSIVQRYLKEIDSGAKFDILTESKILQKQYADDFNSISNLWGRNTYSCSQFSCSCEQGKEFQKLSKTKCDDCPYDNARDQFMEGVISLTNFHMFTLMSLNKLLDRRESKVLIVDEAHGLEDVVSNFVSVTISQHSLISMGFDKPDEILKSVGKITVVEDFVEFCEEYLLDKMNQLSNKLEKEIKGNAEALNREMKIDSLMGTTTEEVKISKQLESIKSNKSRIENFLTEYKADYTNWSLNVEFDEKKNRKLIIQPTWAHPFFDKYIWSKYDKVILMSGTILEKNIFSFVNGIPPNLSEYYMIESPFDVKKRPIYYMPMGKMNYKLKEQTFNNYIPVIKKLLTKYGSQKGIIHSTTFELQDWVNEKIKSKRFISHNSDQKSKNFALKKHYSSKEPTILVSPSMGTGIDLKDDRARFQISLKVPYPNLGDPKNKKRMADRPDWYAWMTVTKLVQTYGRAVRSVDDHAHFIILDSCFGDVLSYSSHLFPEWILRAIKQVNVR